MKKNSRYFTDVNKFALWYMDQQGLNLPLEGYVRRNHDRLLQLMEEENARRKEYYHNRAKELANITKSTEAGKEQAREWAKAGLKSLNNIRENDPERWKQIQESIWTEERREASRKAMKAIPIESRKKNAKRLNENMTYEDRVKIAQKGNVKRKATYDSKIKNIYDTIETNDWFDINYVLDHYQFMSHFGKPMKIQALKGYLHNKEYFETTMVKFKVKGNGGARKKMYRKILPGQK